MQDDAQYDGAEHGGDDGALAEEGRPDIMVVIGGVIPPDDVATLREMGAAAVFPPGTVIADSALDLLAKLSAQLAD